MGFIEKTNLNWMLFTPSVGYFFLVVSKLPQMSCEVDFCFRARCASQKERSEGKAKTSGLLVKNRLDQ